MKDRCAYDVIYKYVNTSKMIYNESKLNHLIQINTL